MKKILLLFMAVLTLSVTARAANGDEFTVDNFKYKVLSEANHEVSIVGYETEPEGDLAIPSFVTNNSSRYFVTSIGENAFYYCWSLTSVTIPNSVTSIDWRAFSGCRGLTSVTIPNSVTEIGGNAFYGCTGLTSVTIPNSVTEIGGNAFSGCNGLTSVTIPNSVTEIGEAAFSYCTGLQEFVVEDGNSKYTAIDGVIYNTTRTAIIAYPGGKEGAFEIPTSVTEIGEAFYGCTGLTSVTIPNSVTEIGGDAFKFCTSLASVSIPNSVTEIGVGAFFSCHSLTSVTIPNSVTIIKSYAFSGCTGLTSVNIPNTVSKIDRYTFSDCTSLTTVVIPSSVTTIGYRAFSGCTALETIYALPATPPACESDAFENVPETAVVYVPKGSFKAYFLETGWTHFTDFREMGALDITLSESSISIEEGKTATLTATVTKDSDVTVESESWTSSDPEVATVDGDGLVTAVGAGTATISYTIVDGYGVPHTESCEVMVSALTGIEGITAEDSEAPAEYFTLSGVRVNGDALTPGLYIKRQGGKACKVLVK